MGKLLIVYYSWSNGNTRNIAERLQKETGADIAKIETVKPYEGSYQDVVDQGKREVDCGFQPEIKSMPAILQIMILLQLELQLGGTPWLLPF